MQDKKDYPRCSICRKKLIESNYIYKGKNYCGKCIYKDGENKMSYVQKQIDDIKKDHWRVIDGREDYFILDENDDSMVDKIIDYMDRNHVVYTYDTHEYHGDNILVVFSWNEASRIYMDIIDATDNE